MEYMGDHLEQYREILEKTNAKFQEFAALEKTHKRSLSDLTLCNLLGTGLFRKLSHLCVRLFADALDLFSLYGDDIPRDARDFLRYRHQCCCLVEINFSGALAKHLVDREWYVCISVRTRNVTVTLVNSSRRFVDVLPINVQDDKFTISSTLNVSIQDAWVCFELEDIKVDASYKITTASVSSSTRLFCLYPLCEDFFPALFENCHHNVDPGVFVQLENGLREEFEFTLMDFPNDKFVLRKDRRICVRSSNADSLYLLKRYLNEAFSERFVVNKDWNAFKEITRLRSLRVDNAEDAEAVYTAVRELWHGVTKPK